MYYSIYNPYSSELYHHGILGQRWGIRRYQNEDGTLTPEGKKRYYKNGVSSRGGYTLAGKRWKAKENKRKSWEKEVAKYGEKEAKKRKAIRTVNTVAFGVIILSPLLLSIGNETIYNMRRSVIDHGRSIINQVREHGDDLLKKPGGEQAYDNFWHEVNKYKEHGLFKNFGPIVGEKAQLHVGLQDYKNRAYNAVNNVKYNARYKYYRAKDFAKGQVAPIRDAINKAKNKRKVYNKAGFYPPAVIR